MGELPAVAFSLAAVTLSAIASHAFHAWLRQRERERLTAADKAELLKRFDEVDNRVRELKNTVSSTRSR